MDKTSAGKKWIYYNFVLAFAVYWFSNLFLWFPWSINPLLGITLMLTVAPIVWGIAVFQSLIRFRGNTQLNGAIIIALILGVVAVVSDYIFFGVIRGAIRDLYKPTTFYGYAFLFTLPFIEILLFPKFISRKKKTITNKDFTLAAILGIACLLALTAIIRLDIKIN
ncbi:MAG: hypothetical protein ACHQIM_05140 [Sphingobacteriales bacterium]